MLTQHQYHLNVLLSTKLQAITYHQADIEVVI